MLLRSPSASVATLLLVVGAASCAALAGLDQDYVVGDAGGAAATGGSNTGIAGAGATGGSAAAGGMAGEDGGVGGSGGPRPTYREVVLSDGPVAYWRFGEASGNRAYDETDFHRHATYNGTIQYGIEGAIVGDPDTAIGFDGSGADVSHTDAFDDFDGTAPFTIETWFFNDGYDGTYRHLYNKDATDLDGRQSIGLYATSANSQGIAFERFVNGMKIEATVAVRPTVAVWHHVVGSYDGGALRLYVDGQEGALFPDDRNQPLKQVTSYIGAKGSEDQVLRGALDEFAIYDRALPVERVIAHWNAGRGF